MNNDLKIYKTNDYDMFCKLEGNRDLRCVEKIKKSIKEVGYILSPICVNEKMEVIDGQNRLQALRELGLPVHYYIVEGLGIKEAIQMNLGRQNWRPIDYAKGYAQRGIKDYQRLLDLLETSGFVSLPNLVSICKKEISGSGSAASIISSGKFKLTEKRKQEVAERVEELNEMQEAISNIEGYQRTIISGVSWLLDVDGVNKDRIKDIITKKYVLIHPVISPRRFLEDISDIYNKNLAKENRFYFDAIYREQLDN